MKGILLSAGLALGVLVCQAQQNNNSDRISGTWLVEDGSAHIRIMEQDGKYHGKIVWLKDPYDQAGRPVTDTRNPETRLRSRPQMGLMLLTDFVYDGDDLWEDGEIYDPDNGNTYSCRITIENRNKMNVRGYIGISLFGRTETWTRVRQENLGSND